MREKIIEGNIYHVLSRGVDKRKIFNEDLDYLRFIHDLFEFNDINPINNVTYFFQNQSKDIARPYIAFERRPRKLLVDLLAFALMPNHYHLLIRPRLEGSLTKFMKRLNMGYAKYFNEKNERTGALFEGRFKSIAVSKEAHFIHLPYYIHLNPLDLCAPEWRDHKLKDYKKVNKFLSEYRWSSHLDYLGKNNFSSVTQREFLLEYFGGHEEYKKDFNNWLKNLDNLKNVEGVGLEPI